MANERNPKKDVELDAGRAYSFLVNRIFKTNLTPARDPSEAALARLPIHTPGGESSRNVNRIMTSTAFQVGDLVRASASVQKLTQGALYIVHDVIEYAYPFGTFVTCEVRLVGEESVIQISNGHLILEAA